VSVRLPAELVEEIDRRTGEMSEEVVGRRSVVVRDVLRAAFAKEGR
jgi:hypothetical protein